MEKLAGMACDGIPSSGEAKVSQTRGANHGHGSLGTVLGSRRGHRQTVMGQWDMDMGRRCGRGVHGNGTRDLDVVLPRVPIRTQRTLRWDLQRTGQGTVGTSVPSGYSEFFNLFIFALSD